VDDDAKKKKELDQVAHALSAVFTERLALPSDNPTAKYIDSIKNEKPEVAAWACSHILNPTLALQANTSQSVEGFLLSSLVKFVPASFAEAETDALTECRNEWDSFREAQSKKEADIKAALDKLELTITSLEGEKRNEHDDLLTQHRDSFTEVEALFKERMRLEAPISFWKEKGRKHVTYSTCWAALFTALVGGYLWGGFSLIASESPRLMATLGNNVEVLERLNLGFVLVALAVLASALLLWPLRIVSRLLLSNLHQATDAKERVTMIETYLALAHDREISAEDRRVLFTAIFRPSAHGIVKEDGAAPPSMASALQRLFEGK
jgi:hypothetical protein